MKPRLSLLTAATVLLAAGGCAPLPSRSLSLPEEHSLVREQLAICSDFPLAPQHRLLEDLTARRYDVSRELSLPLSDEPIYVYLFDDAARFRSFLDRYHPEFPRRRAFFLKTDTRLIVYAHWGDRVAEDLRHEVTHGYVHSVVPSIPLWLDEGLAEYFETPRGSDGVNRAHLQRIATRLRQAQWQPDLRRLERLMSMREMTQDDYAEAWAWVHFLLRSSPERTMLLHGHLDLLRRQGAAEPLSAYLAGMEPVPEAALIAHLGRLASQTGITGRVAGEIGAGP